MSSNLRISKSKNLCLLQVTNLPYLPSQVTLSLNLRQRGTSFFRLKSSFFGVPFFANFRAFFADFSDCFFGGNFCCGFFVFVGFWFGFLGAHSALKRFAEANKKEKKKKRRKAKREADYSRLVAIVDNFLKKRLWKP